MASVVGCHMYGWGFRTLPEQKLFRDFGSTCVLLAKSGIMNTRNEHYQWARSGLGSGHPTSDAEAKKKRSW